MPSNSRAKVMHGNSPKTAGGLSKKDLKYNKQGKIVSKKKSNPIKGKLRKNEFFCVACRCRCQGEDVKQAKARVTGQAMLKGVCKKCENKVAKFIKG